jgi:hypothetical protein
MGLRKNLEKLDSKLELKPKNNKQTMKPHYLLKI